MRSATSQAVGVSHTVASARRSRWVVACVCGLLLGGGVLLSSCEPEVDNGPTCDEPFDGSRLEGTWQLRAHGTRRSCEDRRLEGELSIDTAVPFSVRANAEVTEGMASGPTPNSEADAFVSRIERADFELVSDDDNPKELRVGGRVSGSCVRFTLQEELEDGDVLRYDFDGFIVSGRTATGTFVGTGPENCTSNGSFTLQVQ